MQLRTPAVLWVAFAPEETFAHQSLKNSRDGTRVQVKSVRKFTGRDAGALHHDPEHQSLRAGDAER